MRIELKWKQVTAAFAIGNTAEYFEIFTAAPHHGVMEWMEAV